MEKINKLDKESLENINGGYSIYMKPIPEEEHRTSRVHWYWGQKEIKNRHDYKRYASKLSYVEVCKKIEKLKKTNPNLDFLVTSENELEAYDLMVDKTTKRRHNNNKNFSDLPRNFDL